MAKERFRRTDYSIDTEVRCLSWYDFDTAVEHKVQYDSTSYRLVREPNNATDKNAVLVFLSQLKIGYLPKNVAKIVGVKMDAGDAFSIVHRHSSRGNHYDAKYDNDYSDGYYRDLHISVYNESEIARAKGVDIDPELVDRLTHLPQDQKLGSGFRNAKVKAEVPQSGCMLLLGGLALVPIIIILIFFFSGV